MYINNTYTECSPRMFIAYHNRLYLACTICDVWH